MCSSKSKANCNTDTIISPTSSVDTKRRVLQPNCNRVPLLERPKNSPLKKSTNVVKVRPPSSTPTATPPLSPKMKSPRVPAVKRGSDSNALNSSVERLVLTPKSSNVVKSSAAVAVKKSKKSASTPADKANNNNNSFKCNSTSLIVEAPGSIAAARREQVAIMQEQRKMRIAHYGRTKSIKKVVPDNPHHQDSSLLRDQEKRCTFITPNSDPIYVAYHDEEWGVPVHDDKLLFELLVLIGAQVGSDWTSVLKKRQDFWDAFSGFDAEIVSKFSEKKMNSISTDYGIDLSQVRGVVDNSNRVLEIKKEFGSFDKYLWRFVNNKPIAPKYKSSHKIPVKTSKSESISKDMVKRGFRLVGPTVIHSFMQAAGLSNDHLVTCPRHQHCIQVEQLIV